MIEEILIEEQELSIKSLNTVLIEVMKNPAADELVIEFQKEITKLDIVFIAGLFLIYKECNKTFILNFNGGIIDDEFYKFYQFLKQNEYLTNVPVDHFITKRTINRKKPKYGINETYFVCSKSFAPMLLINEDSFDKIFIDKIQSKNKLLIIYSNNLLENLHLDGGKLNNYITNGILPTNISFVKDKDKIKKYIDAIILITDNLKEKAAIYLYVYYALVSKTGILKAIKTNEIENAAKNLTSLWAFTQEYVRGLKELAKNIIQHTESQQGVITISAFSNKYALETHVIDLNSKGIIPTLIEHTTVFVDSHKDTTILTEDLTILNDGYSVSDFLNPSTEKKLNQQLKRDIAHLGLLVFKKLIESNNGGIYLASNDSNGKRDTYKIEKENTDLLKYGTHFFFNLPFDEKKFTPLKQGETDNSERQASGQTVESLSKIINFELVDGLEKHDSHFKIVNHEIENPIGNREDENDLFETIGNKIKKANTFFAIDLNFHKIESSSLFRLIAHLALADVNKNFIIYNIECDTYLDMLKQNDTYFQVFEDKEISYWNDSKGVLVYCYKEIIKENEVEHYYYNFADMLFGKDEESFLRINKLINNTFPNLITISNNKNNEENGEIHNGIKDFFHQQVLLPFDIVLKQNNGYSLFDNNLKVVLTNELTKEDNA